MVLRVLILAKGGTSTDYIYSGFLFHEGLCFVCIYVYIYIYIFDEHIVCSGTNANIYIYICWYIFICM